MRFFVLGVALFHEKPMMEQFHVLTFLWLTAFWAAGFSQPAPSPPPPHCAQILFCLYNQEAAANDPAGIHNYSQDLIGMVVPNLGGEDSIRQLTSHLADRLAEAEQAARAGHGRLVPEAAVVKAFNDLMQEIGAPPSMRASEASLREFREHAASINAFPALFSADRNGTNCNPGEAVFLLSLLLSDNGVPYERNLDSQAAMMRWDDRQSGPGAATGSIGPIGSSASQLLFLYSLHHNLNANTALFAHIADTLGI